MFKQLICFALLTTIASFASADVYLDNTGNHLSGGDLHDFFQSQGFDHLDIASVEVTNDTSFLYFDITLNADIDATNWGKYLVGIDTALAPGDVSNGWGRNFTWGANVSTDFLGTWADDGGSGAGGEYYQWDGASWVLADATYLAGTQITASDAGHALGIQSVAVSLGSLGVGVGDTIGFDVVSTAGGGGDPGVDHLSRSDFSTDDWANASTSGQFLSYTITGIPEPGSMVILMIGGVMAVVRRRRSA